MNEQQKKYIERVAAYAIKQYPTKKILPSLVIAQCILETGWFNSSLFTNAWNFTGIKYTKSCGTDKVRMKTCEFYKNSVSVNQIAKAFDMTVEEVCKLNKCDKSKVFQNQYVLVYDYFRKYKSFEEGLEGHYIVLNTKRYSNLIGVTDHEKACELVQQDGWATSPVYATNLVSVISSNNLTKYDKEVVGSAKVSQKVSNNVTATYKAGQTVKLSKCSLYASATATKKAATKSGTYYIWNTSVKNGRIRITNNKKLVGKIGGVTGWILVSAIK